MCDTAGKNLTKLAMRSLPDIPLETDKNCEGRNKLK